jgi:hypothetical protein
MISTIIGSVCRMNLEKIQLVYHRFEIINDVTTEAPRSHLYFSCIFIRPSTTKNNKYKNLTVERPFIMLAANAINNFR